MERGLFRTGTNLIATTPIFLLLGFCASTPTPVALDSSQLVGIGIQASAGSRWAALPPDSLHSETIILRDGTEWGRIDTAKGKRIPSARDWTLPDLPTTETLLAWTTPPDGLALGWTFRRSRARASSPMDRNILSASYDQPWKNWVSIGIVGGMERTYTKFGIDSISNDPANLWWPSWGGRACLRSLCWESRTADHPIAEAAWTQRGMDSLAVKGRDGKLVRGWDNPTSDWNWEHSLTARIGLFEWRTTIDGDRWEGAEHEMLLTTANSGIVRWGALVGTNDTRAWTGFAVGIEPREFALPAHLSLESSPTTVVFRYADNQTLSFEIRTALRLPSPWKLP